jgi:hypothetical protein
LQKYVECSKCFFKCTVRIDVASNWRWSTTTPWKQEGRCLDKWSSEFSGRIAC